MTPKLTAAERELLIIERRADRVPFRTIAAELGISAQRVHQLWRTALVRIPAARLEEHRAEELELYDVAVRELLGLARDSRAGIRSRVEAWNAVRGWAERKAKLLGLDAPKRAAVSVIDMDMLDEEILRLTKELETV